MSLENKFNKSFIKRIDDYFLDVNSRISKKWQDKTYRCKDDLASYLYLISGTGYFSDFFINFSQEKLSNSINYLPSGICSIIFYSFDEFRFKNNFHEEAVSSLLLNNKNFFKYLNFFGYNLCALSLISGLNNLSLGYFNDNYEILLKSAEDLSFSLATLSLVSANYISKSDIEEPPKKSKKEKIYERVYNFFRDLVPKKVYE